jgi:hypothetical protein
VAIGHTHDLKKNPKSKLKIQRKFELQNSKNLDLGFRIYLVVFGFCMYWDFQQKSLNIRNKKLKRKGCDKMHDPYLHRYKHRRHHWPYHHYPWWLPDDDIPPIPEPPYEYGYPYHRGYPVPRWTKEDELKMLEEEELALEEELEMLRKRKEEIIQEKEVK